jgi:Flp pilus assembly protein TadD
MFPIVCIASLVVFLASCGGREEAVAYTLVPLGDAAVEEETDAGGVRVFTFAGGVAGGDARVRVTPEGFYTVQDDGSGGGGARIGVQTENERYLLSQFAGGLFRPDIVERAGRGEAVGSSLSLAGLLREGVPAVTVLHGGEESGGARTVRLLVAEGGGGAGDAALYRPGGKGDVLWALFDIEDVTVKQYEEKGTRYREIAVPVPETGAFRVSVFNKERTVESARVLLADDAGGVPPESPSGVKPALHVLLAAGNGDTDNAGDAAGTLETLFANQKDGTLYSNVIFYNTHTTHNGGFDNNDLSSTINTITAIAQDINYTDVFVLYLSARAELDGRGDFVFPAGDSATPDTPGTRDLLHSLVKIKTPNALVLLDTGTGLSAIETETGFARLNAALGRVPAVMPSSRFLAHADAFTGTGERYLSMGDITLLDRFAGYGEITMQSMASGLVSIDGLAEAPGVLGFGETLRRTLPAGTYSVTMTYRNGRKETKAAEVRGGTSRWLIFSYVPELLEGDFSRLPGFGVNITELNPRNYDRYDPQALGAMGAAPWQQAFLAAEDFYKKGTYDRAIAEYTRALSLKQDSADAYVGRGSAYRRAGNYTAAAADYTRAIALKPDYAEAYNYRGYVYSLQGDFRRAAADYTQAVKYRSGYGDAYFNRGYAYGELGDWDRAAADYTQVIRLEPSNAAAYNERGNAWFYREDYDRAIGDYTEAIRLRPGYATAYRSRGNAWYSTGDREKAAADYDAAEQADKKTTPP